MKRSREPSTPAESLTPVAKRLDQRSTPPHLAVLKSPFPSPSVREKQDAERTNAELESKYSALEEMVVKRLSAIELAVERLAEAQLEVGKSLEAKLQELYSVVMRREVPEAHE